MSTEKGKTDVFTSLMILSLENEAYLKTQELMLAKILAKLDNVSVDDVLKEYKEKREKYQKVSTAATFGMTVEEFEESKKK